MNVKINGNFKLLLFLFGFFLLLCLFFIFDNGVSDLDYVYVVIFNFVFLVMRFSYFVGNFVFVKICLYSRLCYFS